MRNDDCVMLGRPAHGNEASSSRAAPPASDGTATRPEQEREHVNASPTHFADAQAEQALWQEFRDHGASLNWALNEALRIHGGPTWRVFRVCDFSPGSAVFSPSPFFAFAFPLTPVFSCFVRRWQELEGRARERYGILDRLDADPSWYRGQYNALDALVEALRTPDRWLVYRAEALRDQPPELDTQAAEDVSAVEKVKIALVDRDEVLHKVREDLAGARSLAAEWEAQVASVRAQLQQDRAALQGARAWQSQAEKRAKEAEGLRASLADKAAALATTEDRLRPEQVARQQAEDQLQQERTTLAEARAALEGEPLAQEEAQGQLQQERAALEEA
jgi:DNA repair exonuclease SbcCD ATPase subunit